jgi:hypothetical protein
VVAVPIGAMVFGQLCRPLQCAAGGRKEESGDDHVGAAAIVTESSQHLDLAALQRWIAQPGYDTGFIDWHQIGGRSGSSTIETNTGRHECQMAAAASS